MIPPMMVAVGTCTSRDWDSRLRPASVSPLRRLDRTARPAVVMPGADGVEAADDVELVPATRRNRPAEGAPAELPGQSSAAVKGSEGIGRGVVTEDTAAVARRMLAACRAAHAVDLRSAAHGQNTAGHIVHLEIRKRGRLGRPGIGGRVELEGWVKSVPATSALRPPME